MKSLKSVDNQCITLLVLILLLASCNPKKENKIQSDAEVVKQDSLWRNIELYDSETDYTLVIDNDSIRRILSFRKNVDSSEFRYINYQISNNQKRNLKDEIQFIDRLWRLAEDSINITPKGIMVGYPLEYKDVLKNHIEALKETGNFDINNYDSLRLIMISKHVYQPLETYLKSRGYQLTKISTEKHGYVPKDDLKELGYPDSLKIPVPYMVWLEVKPNY